MKLIAVTSITTLLLAGSLVALATAGAARLAASATDQCIQPGDTPVRMKTKDGVSVYGVEVGTGTTGVVLGHQYFSDHCEFMALARELAGHGLAGAARSTSAGTDSRRRAARTVSTSTSPPRSRGFVPTARPA